MKIWFVLLIAVSCFSFRPVTEKMESNTRPGFYIFVEDYTTRTNHKFVVESKDSVNFIFNNFFQSELQLGHVDRPITIYNGKQNFYVARVVLFDANGKTKFRSLKYTNVYKKRSKLRPVTL